MREGIPINIPDNTSKAELPQEGISFRTQFSSVGFFINKKAGFRKNQGHLKVGKFRKKIIFS